MPSGYGRLQRYIELEIGRRCFCSKSAARSLLKVEVTGSAGAIQGPAREHPQTNIIMRIWQLCKLPVERSTPGQLDIAKRIDAGIEEAADDSRSLGFDDDGGAGDQGTRAQFAPLMDRHVDEFTRFGVENRARALGLGRIWLRCRCDGLTIG